MIRESRTRAGLSLLVASMALGCSVTTTPVATPSPPQQAAVATDPRVGELETRVRELTDRLEVMQARLETMSDTLAELLDAPPEQRRAVPTPGGPLEQAIRRQVDVGEAAELYKDAQIAYARGNIEDSRALFERVYRADPLGDLADNALYWIGESYFVMGQYDAAARVYDTIVNQYGDQNRAPDAMLRLAESHARRGDLQLAREVYERLIERYSWSSAAATARQEIERIRY